MWHFAEFSIGVAAFLPVRPCRSTVFLLNRPGGSEWDENRPASAGCRCVAEFYCAQCRCGTCSFQLAYGQEAIMGSITDGDSCQFRIADCLASLSKHKFR